MKKLLSLLLVVVMLLGTSSTAFVSNGAIEDPADSYTKITAPNEDSNIRMWFEHSTVKVLQNETTSTGRDTYSIYMGKNESQGAQIILCSNVAKSNLKAEIADKTFTAMDGSGATIPAQLYYEFYVNVDDACTEDIYGLSAGDDSIIKNGMIPDAIAPVENINAVSRTSLGRFGLSANKTQALYYKLTTATDTPSGWYSATFNLKNASDQIVKTATIYAYVWDFVVPEETEYQTAFYISSSDPATYKTYYDYLLSNRLLGFNVPGEISPDNEYLNNPRVTAFRVSNHGSYLGKMDNDSISAVYDKLSASENWETYKKKAYFYTVDEPTSQEQSDLLVNSGIWTSHHPTVDTIISEYNRISLAWEKPFIVVPYHENTPYPYYSYSKTIAQNSNGSYTYVDDGRNAFNNIKDATQGMMDSDSVTVWCPKMCAYTPNSIIKKSGYLGVNTEDAHVRNLNGIISGFDITNFASCYFDWDSKFGTFEDRFNAYQADRAAKGKDIKLWWYACGNNSNYTYANHLIENTGLQTQIMTWQAMQVGSTGYLYYGVDLWTEINKGSENYAISGSGISYDGSVEEDMWAVNLTERNSHDIYGNGVLMYGSEMQSKLKLKQTTYLGTIRVEQLRDGVEDYIMLELYRDIYGEEAMQNLISKVSDNVACYLSLPLFDTSDYASNMTPDDIFQEVRIELGNAIEAGQDVGCTEHAWDEGKVTTAATCVDAGVKTFTCTNCGETKTEEISATGKHTWDDGVETIAPTLKTDGEMTYTCTVCGETYTEVIPLTAEPGDANGDGRFKANDLLILKKYIADDPITIQYIESRLDVNQDNRINIVDIRLLKRLISGE